MTINFLERLAASRPVAPAPVFDGLAQVRAYWEGLRKDTALPPRTALDPRGLAGVLDRVFLAERIGRGLAQMRISGSGLADFAGVDLRGLPLSCILAPESRPIFAETLENVFMSPAVAEIDLGSDRGALGAIVARLVLMPLADDGDRKLVLGVLSFAQTDRRRCKFQVLKRREEQLVVQAVAAPEAEPVPTRRFGHLTLVHSAE
jgi:hypothetical protein